MKILVTAVILTLSIISIESKPHVEVEKQRLIEIPTDDTTKIILKQQSEQAKRIYDEIAKINEALGYTKRGFSSKITAINNDHEGYFYPRATEQLHLPVFLRTSSNQSPRHSAKQIIGFVPNPFNQQTYYYPAPYLHLPLRDEPRLFRTEEDYDDDDTSDDDTAYIYRTLPKSEIEENYREDKMTKFKKTNKGESVNTEVEDLLTAIAVDGISDIEAVIEDESEEETSTKASRVHNDKYMMEDRRVEKVSKTGRTSSDRDSAHTTPISVSSERPSSLKTFGFPPLPNKLGSKKPITSGTKITPVTEKPEKEAVKAPNFGQLFITPGTQAIRDVMKEGGIVIQRLKVRKGGIAIAGPGGVATAGSGGTAIVGPGGLALTHPRGLSIAGPGARVVSIPEHIDLEQVARKATARSIPVEGMLVATGPIVYYNP